MFLNFVWLLQHLPTEGRYLAYPNRQQCLPAGCFVLVTKWCVQCSLAKHGQWFLEDQDKYLILRIWYQASLNTLTLSIMKEMRIICIYLSLLLSINYSSLYFFSNISVWRCRCCNWTFPCESFFLFWKVVNALQRESFIFFTPLKNTIACIHLAFLS